MSATWSTVEFDEALAKVRADKTMLLSQRKAEENALRGERFEHEKNMYAELDVEARAFVRNIPRLGFPIPIDDGGRKLYPGTTTPIEYAIERDVFGEYEYYMICRWQLSMSEAETAAVFRANFDALKMDWPHDGPVKASVSDGPKLPHAGTDKGTVRERHRAGSPD